MNQSSTSSILTSTANLKRKKQIDSLHIINNDVREVHPGEYYIPFQLGSQECKLRIQLPPDFPAQQPLIWINPTVQHNWVTDHGRILSPGLVNYTEQSDLGQIVHGIVREMKKLSEANIYPNEFRNSENNSFLPASQFSHHEQQYFQLPPFIPELEGLSKNHVRKINENGDILDQFVEELPQAVGAIRDTENHLETVEKLAKSVAELKTGLNEKRQKLVEHYEVLNQLKQDWDSLSAQHQTLSQRFVPNNIEASLKHTAALSDEKSEDIAEVFLSGRMEVEAFLNSYTASRTVSHTRKMKEEILHRQLQELQRLGY